MGLSFAGFKIPSPSLIVLRAHRRGARPCERGREQAGARRQVDACAGRDDSRRDRRCRIALWCRPLDRDAGRRPRRIVIANIFKERCSVRIRILAAVLSASISVAVQAEPVQDRWNLADLYATQGDWDADAAKAATQLKELDACKGQLGASSARFKACMGLFTDLQKRFSRLGVYASETNNQDTSETTGLELEQRFRVLRSSFGNSSSFVRPEILALGKPKIDSYLAEDKSLDIYRHDLDNILRGAAHTLDAQSEGLIAQFGLSSDTASSTYTILATADMPWPQVKLSDGSTITLDQSAYTKYRAVQNRADRKLVMDAFFGQFKQFERTFGATLYGQMKVDSVNAKVHHYPDVITRALDRSAIPVAVDDTLISEANAHLPTLHRYFRLRAKMLGVTDLHYYDIYPPLVKEDRKYSLDDAKRLTLEAVAPLGPDYVAAMKNGFDHRWMDAYPRPHKLSGAHMAGSAYDVHPYVLVNYNDDYESVTTVAHEWGHALHSVLANKAQSFNNAGYPIFIAEIASTFNEAMLLQHMLEIAKSDDERLLYLGSALETLRGTYFRQAMFAEFERDVHAKVDSGQALSGAAMTKMYGDILKRYHGDTGDAATRVMKIDDVDAIEWAYIPHFYNAFYVYQYSTSIAASSLFADSVQKKEPGSRERYLGLLQAGGSDYPYDLVKKAGVDLATAAPYQSIAARMDHIMDDIEAILARRSAKS
jgi:oligoendopeptidase F